MVSLGMAVLLIVHLYGLLFIPYLTEIASETVEIPSGSSVKQTALILREKGRIPSVPAFILLTGLTRSQGPVHAGEYKIPEPSSAWQILNILRHGSQVLHLVTIPEGMRSADVAGIMAEKLSLSKARFLALLTDPVMIRSLGLDTPSLEGYLMPETYAFPKNMTEEKVIRKMVDGMLAFFDQEKMKRAESLGMSLHQVLILASIIEKEAGSEEECPLISSVFHNRLKKHMLLQSDPTVIYGIKNFDGNLQESELKTDGPYNTYLRQGLPPTPIANPGKSSILAALYPAETSYLYFVSRNDRTHAFSRTLHEHNMAVNRYQRKRAADSETGSLQ